MFGFGKPQITIANLALIMVQASIDPRAEERDWDIVKSNQLNRARFRREWFCFRTFITLVMAESVLNARVYQSFVDAYFGTVATDAPVDGATLQERVTRYINISNASGKRLTYGTVAEVCTEFSEMCGFSRRNIVLTSFADSTTYFFGRAQLTRLKSFKVDRRSFVTTYDGTMLRY